MSISLWISNRSYEIGKNSFFWSFFSTVYIKLEKDNWGSLFPVIMNEFYSGNLSYKRCNKAIEELKRIREMLKAYPPEQIVWDAENLNTRPPWGGDISTSITSLSNYFLTSSGNDLFDVILNAFEEALKKRNDVIIK